MVASFRFLVEKIKIAKLGAYLILGVDFGHFFDQKCAIFGHFDH